MKLIVFFQVFFITTLAAQNINVKFDFSQSELIINAFQNKGSIDDRFFDQLKNSYSTSILLKRVQKRNPAITFDSLIADLKVITSGKQLDHADYFRLGVVHRDLKKHRSLITEIRAKQKNLENELKKNLLKFIGDDEISITIHFIMLGTSFGFAPDEKNFCIGLHWYDGDLTGVRWVMAHELFHNVQALYPAKNEDSIVPLNKRLLYQYLIGTYKEGTATFISDVKDYPSIYTKQHLDRQQKAISIITDHFLLAETIMYRLYHDQSFDNSDLANNIGSGWDWGNPNYYVGYIMCRALVKYKGEGYIKSSLSLTPTKFFIDYFEIADIHKEDKSIVQFSPAIKDIIRKFDRELK